MMTAGIWIQPPSRQRSYHRRAAAQLDDIALPFKGWDDRDRY
jgi:hypothetical protein